MSWLRWDVAIWGRLAGGLIFVAGIGLGIWNAWATHGISTSERYQTFLSELLGYAFYGTLVVQVAEIAVRMRPRAETAGDADAPDTPPPPNEGHAAEPVVRWDNVWRRWNGLDFVVLGRAAGVLIMVGGVALSFWESVTQNQFGLGLGASTTARAFLSIAIYYVFEGSLIIALAELAELMGRRSVQFIP